MPDEEISQKIKEHELDLPYVALIPYSVLSNKVIQPAAKVHYACLAGLAKKQGYCWATDEQLANMHEVDVRTIKRWNQSLEAEGFIKKVCKNVPYRNNSNNMLWRTERKIYVNNAFTMMPENDDNPVIETGRDENCPPIGRDENCPPVGEDRNGPPLDKESLKKESLKEETSQLANTSLRFATLLFELILKLDPKAKKPNLNTWASDIDKLIRIDGRSEEDVEKTIRWSLSHDFWCKHILSGRKLREKFSQLYIDMQQQKKDPKKKKEAESKVKADRAVANRDWAKSFFMGLSLKKGDNRMMLRDNGVEVKFNKGYHIIGFLEHGFAEQVKSMHMKIMS